jgi:hypothetical protein
VEPRRKNLAPKKERSVPTLLVGRDERRVCLPVERKVTQEIDRCQYLGMKKCAAFDGRPGGAAAPAAG